MYAVIILRQALAKRISTTATMADKFRDAQKQTDVQQRLVPQNMVEL